MAYRNFILINLAVSVISGAAIAQEAAPQRTNLIDRAEQVAEVSARVRPIMALDPQRKVIVDGEMPWSSMILAAREIVFKPGSRLVFHESLVNTAAHFFIVADRLVVEDPNNPGVITWARSSPSAPGDRGRAAAGPPGAGHGAGGGAGAAGAPGQTGAEGTDSPALTLMARTLVNGGVVVDFRGGSGGAGGVGQVGGNGGGGAQGTPARQSRTRGPFNATIWNPWCDAGPGQGGRGGDGGAGGPGGLGGTGGDGGNVTLVSLNEHLPVFTQSIRVNIGGGDGGAGGAGGAGGPGGPGGPEGQLANFCNSAGRHGGPGSGGTTGPFGNKGAPGKAGQSFIAPLNNEQFAALFGF